MRKYKVLISGCDGYMGQTLYRCLANHPSLELSGGIDLHTRDVEAAIQACDVVVDFSSHTGTADLVRNCAAKKKPLVIGTTGHTMAEEATIYAETGIPIVHAPNFSVEVISFCECVSTTARLLGKKCAVDIIDVLHAQKSAPSGTAKTLAKLVAEARGQSPDDVVRYSYPEKSGARNPEEIYVHSIRGGDVVGDHKVVFSTEGSRLELTHRASSRDPFAHGALNAARWVIGKPPGVYDLLNVMGLK